MTVPFMKLSAGIIKIRERIDRKLEQLIDNTQFVVEKRYQNSRKNLHVIARPKAASLVQTVRTLCMWH
jgi:hypothetical protein